MNLVVRTAKAAFMRFNLLNSLELGTDYIVATPTNYKCITLLNLNESALPSLNTIHNTEAILLNEANGAGSLQLKTIYEANPLNHSIV